MLKLEFHFVTSLYCNTSVIMLFRFQMPSDLLFGVDPLRTLPDFLFLYTNLNLIDVKYTKFRDYLNQISTEGKISKISTEDVIYDVLNNQTGVEKVVHEIYKIAYDQADSMKQELHRVSLKNIRFANIA